jgi:hypothetical protein
MYTHVKTHYPPCGLVPVLGPHLRIDCVVDENVVQATASPAHDVTTSRCLRPRPIRPIIHRDSSSVLSHSSIQLLSITYIKNQSLSKSINDKAKDQRQETTKTACRSPLCIPVASKDQQLFLNWLQDTQVDIIEVRAGLACCIACKRRRCQSRSLKLKHTATRNTRPSPCPSRLLLGPP